MNWSDIITSIALSVIGLAVPYALVLFRQKVVANIKDEKIKQWVEGAGVAAGRAYETLMRLKENNPGASISTLARRAAESEARMFFALYEEKSKEIGATAEDATTRVRGEMGKLLAADPNITVEPVAVVVPDKVQLVEAQPKIPLDSPPNSG